MAHCLFRFSVLLISTFTLVACNKDTEPADIIPTSTIQQTSILPLGASRVEGAPPYFESYRYELWRRLVDGQHAFDFVGTANDGFNYEEYAGKTFDSDHEGHGGWTSGQILDGLPDWLAATGAPDIILFSSPGGNDALEGLPYAEIIENVNAIIDLLQAANPNCVILLEQPAPARSDAMTEELAAYIESMQADVLTIAQAQSTPNCQVFPVDMFTGYTDAMCADEVHYNQEGAAFIAERYYEILETLLD